MINKPSWRFGERYHTRGENDGWYHLETPRDSKRGYAVDIRAAKLDEVLDEDAPSDGPLLNSDKTSPNMRSCNLRLIDGDDSGCKADRDTRDDSTSGGHTSVLCTGERPYVMKRKAFRVEHAYD